MATSVQAVPPEWPLSIEQTTDTGVLHHRGHDDGPQVLVTKGPLDKVPTTVTVEEVGDMLEVVGSTNIYDDEGKIRLIPTPTPNPKDPLNLPNWRKYTAIGCLCFFGSLSLCADMVVAGLLPVFLLEYSGVDPRPILKHADMKGDSSPLAIVPAGVVPVSLYQVTLLSTLPSLSNCVAGYFLVPLSLAIGRRPVLIFTAMCSWVGGMWAAYSNSLQEHLFARVVHGLGSSTVEALLPLIMQDMVFIHQRNRAIAAILACQGPMLTIFGIISPYVATNYSWRWLYLISSSVSILAWLLILAFVPESRQLRSKQELNGQAVWPVEPGKNRPELDYVKYGHRTLWDNIGVLNRGFEWKEAGIQMLRTLQTTYFPAILAVIMIDAMFFIVLSSMGQTISFALLAAGIPYELSGLTVITNVFSSVVVYIFGGPLADKLSLKISKIRGRKDREPEYQLPNLIVPLVSAMAGCAIFGCAQHFHLHVAVLLTGSFFLSIGTMTAATILKTFIIESYPHWPGPVLVNVSTYRTIISFFFSSHATTWVQEKGSLFVFGVYIAVLFVMSGFIPIFFFFGKRFRIWTSGRVGTTDISGASPSAESVDSDEKTLNRVLSGDTLGSPEKNLTRVMSMETVETMDSVEKHCEKRSMKSSL